MLLHSCPDIYKVYPFNKLIKSHSSLLEEKIEKAKKVLTEQLSENGAVSYDDLEINFSASRTAINNLNFISIKDSDSLKHLRTEDPFVLDFIKLLYIVLNES